MELAPHAMTRARLYVLIDALETDLRDLIERWVIADSTEGAALGPFFEQAQERRQLAESRGEEPERILDFLDLQDSISLLNIHRRMLPTDLAEAVRQQTPVSEDLVPTRHRVMHGRPLLPHDPERTITSCSGFVRAYPFGNLRAVVTRLSANPDWSPLFQGTSDPTSAVLHNLPFPDFDETGLVGRGRESRDLLRRLILRREPVTTVSGEGGIGKTALAVKVLYDLIDDADCPYEAVLWASLKTERLTGEGISTLTDVIGDLVGITQELARAIGDEMTLDELGSFLDGIQTLVVIDNLETADANEILTLYDAMPDSVTFLFTSRVGLGQLERRMVLGPLTEGDSGKLLRGFARHRNLEHISRMDDQQVNEIVAQLRFNPLGIRWFVLAIEAGAQPQMLLQDQRDLLDFCIRTVHDRLSPEAREVLTILYALDRQLAFAELSILSGFDIDALRASLLEMQRSSMLEIDSDRTGGLGQTYALTITSRHYLAKVAPPPSADVERALAKDNELRISEERRRLDESRRRLGPNSVHVRNDLDKPVAHLLRLALVALWRKNEEEAKDLVRQAEELAPDFFEVYRVEAFIESSLGHVEAANRLYEKAMEQAPLSWKATVAYYLAGHLARAAHDPSAALEYAQDAYDSVPGPDEAQLLGQILMYLGQFNEARERFTEAAEAGGKVGLIATTSLVELARREAEHLLGDSKQPLEAFNTGMHGAELGLEALRKGTLDRRLVEVVVEGLSETLRSATQVPDIEAVEGKLAELISAAQQVRQRWPAARAWGYWERHLDWLRQRDNLPDGVRKAVEAAATPPPEVDSSERLSGSVKNYFPDRRFGFIRAETRGDLFFARAFLMHPSDEVLLVPGVRIQYSVGYNDQGTCAINVEVPASTGVLSMRRRGEVISKVDTFAFVKDEQTGVHVFVHQTAMRRRKDWRNVSEGVVLEYEVTVTGRGPAAAKGSCDIAG